MNILEELYNKGIKITALMNGVSLEVTIKNSTIRYSFYYNENDKLVITELYYLDKKEIVSKDELCKIINEKQIYNLTKNLPRFITPRINFELNFE